MIDEILKHAERPTPYEESTSAFWNDAHISKGMLEAHVNPDLDSATRSHDFVEKSVRWIADMFPSSRYGRLLDLGCGPGIYAERFHAAGYRVTGLDLSARSIGYARDSAARRNMEIDYVNGSYLGMDYDSAFELAVLIYCDFGVLPETDRDKLLRNIFRSLKPNGKLLFDVFTSKRYEGRAESRNWSAAASGFWSEAPYLCLHAFYRYDDIATFVDRYIVATAEAVNCYNVWDHAFTTEELRRDLRNAGFDDRVEFYGDIGGAAFSAASETLCAVAHRPDVRGVTPH